MIAVTGANGLVGSFIVKKLIGEGLPVVAILRHNSETELLDEIREKITIRYADILDVPSLEESLTQVQTVIHTAAIVSFSPRKTGRIFEVNVAGTKNIVNTCLASGISKLIHISSVAALGRVKGVQTIDEQSKWVNSPLNSDYAESKYRAELEVYRGIEEGLNATLINPSVVLAPADWTKSSAKLFQYAWQERTFYSEGSLNYVDARDVAEMTFRILSRDLQGQRFIASAGVVTLEEFFKETGRRFKKKPPSVKVGRSWMGLAARVEEFRSWISGSEPLITRQSIRLAREVFYYNPQKSKDVLNMTFRPLEETLDWCCAQYLQNVTSNK